MKQNQLHEKQRRGVGQNKLPKWTDFSCQTHTNDFFVNLLDMGIEWKAISEANDVFEGRDRATGAI